MTTRPLDRDEIDLDEVVRILTEDFHVPNAYVEMTGGGCATIYAGDPISWQFLNGSSGQAYDVYPVVCGPGTYQHRETGVSTGTLFELCVGLDYEIDEGESIVDCAAVGAHDAESIARLIALMVTKQDTLDTDTLEEYGFDPSLRSAPDWLTHQQGLDRERSDRHNARLRVAYDKGATTEQAVAYAAGDNDDYDDVDLSTFSVSLTLSTIRDLADDVEQAIFNEAEGDFKGFADRLAKAANDLRDFAHRM